MTDKQNATCDSTDVVVVEMTTYVCKVPPQKCASTSAPKFSRLVGFRPKTLDQLVWSRLKTII
jgi:hypothetical protein